MYTREELHVERIKPDTSFMEEKLVKVKLFFEVAVLPELLGRWFSRPPERISMNNCESLPNSVPACFENNTLDSSSPTTSGANRDDIEPNSNAYSPGMHGTDKYCYCQQGKHGKMIGCDNDSCAYQWFHMECLKLKSFPKSSKWYCPDCWKFHRNKYICMS